MLRAIPLGDRRAVPATSRVAVRLCLGDSLKNEVPMPTRPRLHHLVPLLLPYSACADNRSATLLSSVSAV